MLFYIIFVIILFIAVYRFVSLFKIVVRFLVCRVQMIRSDLKSDTHR